MKTATGAFLYCHDKRCLCGECPSVVRLKSLIAARLRAKTGAPGSSGLTVADILAAAPEGAFA
jgi:hypothetical protein